jgi:hypothetical protein
VHGRTPACDGDASDGAMANDATAKNAAAATPLNLN